jgi:O-antigen/teichoic acid export membrane protein
VESLKQRTFRGSLALGSATLGLRVISVLTSIILARLLLPSAFGQVALAQVVLSIVAIFVTLGLPSALIQTPLDKGKAAYSALVVNVVVGVFITLLLITTAPWLGFLVGDTSVQPILQWLSLTVLFGSVTRVPESMIQKDLLFGRLGVMGIIVEVVTIGLAILFAWMGWGAWSLVYANVIASIVNAILAWAFLPDRSWLALASWDRDILSQMMGFGLRMVGSSSVYTVYSYVDNYVVGRVLGTTALGYYSKAFDLTSRTVDSINRTIGAVLFPSYAQVQHDKERLARAYLKSLKMISIMTVPIAAGMFAVAEELVIVLLGREWAPAVPALRVLTLMSLLKPISSTTSALFTSSGHPEYNLRAGIVVTVVLLGGIAVFFPWGIVGVAWAVVVAHAVGLAYNVYQVQSLLPGTVWSMALATLPSLGSSLLMVCAVAGVRILAVLIQSTSLTLPVFLVLVATGMLVYGGALLVIQRPLVREVLEMLKTKRAPTSQGAGA